VAATPRRRIRRRWIVLLSLLAVALVLLAVPRVSMLARGATPLRLATVGFQPISLGGAGVGLLDTRFEDRDGDVVFIRIDTGEPYGLAWPWGYSAWLVDGRAELMKPEGTILAVEGDRLTNLGGFTRDDDTLLVDAGIGGSAVTVLHP
jgi:hypothetical protein